VILAGGLIIGVVTLAVRWPPPPASWGFTGFQIPIAIAFGAMGILLLRSQPGNRIGWLLLLEGTITAVQFGVDLPAQTLSRTAPTTSVAWIAWFSNWAWILSVTAIPPLFLVFPDGRPIGRRWARAIPLLGAGAVLMVVGMATIPGQLQNYPSISRHLRGVG